MISISFITYKQLNALETDITHVDIRIMNGDYTEKLLIK